MRKSAWAFLKFTTTNMMMTARRSYFLYRILQINPNPTAQEFSKNCFDDSKNSENVRMEPVIAMVSFFQTLVLQTMKVLIKLEKQLLISVEFP